MREIEAYLRAIIRIWWALMSCAAFTVLSIWAVATNRTPNWVVWASIALSFAMLLIASFFAWREQFRQHVAAESALAALRDERVPQLLVKYVKPEPRSGRPTLESMERLALTNSGKVPWKSPHFGPLVWTDRDQQVLEFMSNIAPVLPGDTDYLAFQVVEQLTANVSSGTGPFPDVYRAALMKLGSEAQPRIEVTYENLNGERFSRGFIVSIDPFDQIVFDPEPVRIVG